MFSRTIKTMRKNTNTRKEFLYVQKNNIFIIFSLPDRAGDKMIKFHFKKSEHNLEMNFSCDFEKIISLIIGTSTLVETFLRSL